MQNSTPMRGITVATFIFYIAFDYFITTMRNEANLVVVAKHVETKTAFNIKMSVFSASFPHIFQSALEKM